MQPSLLHQPIANSANAASTILATLCYVRSQGKTLFMHRNKRSDDVHFGKYNGLGGKFDAGESPEECVIREVYEESGLHVFPQMRGVMTFPKFSKSRDWLCFLFTAETESRNIKVDCPEGDLVWIDHDKIFDLELWPGDKIFLSWLDQPHFFSAKFNYENGELRDHKVTFYER